MTDECETWQVRDVGDPESRDPWPVVRGLLALSFASAWVLFLMLECYGDVDLLYGPRGTAFCAFCGAAVFASVVRGIVQWLNRRTAAKPAADRKRRSWAFCLTIAIVLTQALYVASFGPACWMVDRGKVAARPVARIYRPILRATWRWEAVGKIADTYIEVGANDARWTLTPA